MWVWRSQLLQQPHEILRQRHKGRLAHRTLGMNDYVPSCGYLLPVAAYHFTQSPPDAVAHHRAAQCLLDAEAEAVQGKFVGPNEDGEVAAGNAFSGLVDAVKITSAHQARFARKRLALRGLAATTRA